MYLCRDVQILLGDVVASGPGWEIVRDQIVARAAQLDATQQVQRGIQGVINLC